LKNTIEARQKREEKTYQLPNFTPSSHDGRWGRKRRDRFRSEIMRKINKLLFQPSHQASTWVAGGGGEKISTREGEKIGVEVTTAPPNYPWRLTGGVPSVVKSSSEFKSTSSS